MKMKFLAIALAATAFLSLPALAVTGNGGGASHAASADDVTAQASAAAKKVLAQLEASIKKIEDLIEQKAKPEEIRDEVAKARKTVDDAVDRVSVTGGRGTQRNISLRQMQTRLESFSAVVTKNVEDKTRAEMKNLKAALLKVEASFKAH